MGTGLTTYCFGFNVSRYKYPWIEAIESSLPISDQVIFVECFSEDDTWEQAQELAEQYEKLLLLRHPWGSHHTVQSHICNYALDHVETKWHLKLDCDECIHHESYAVFLDELRFMEARNIIGGRPHYTHFVRDMKTVFPFIYSRKTVLGLREAGWRYKADRGDDACQLFFGQGVVMDLSLEIFHVGKVSLKREEAAIEKEYKFQQLYTDVGFPDPLVVKQYETTGRADYDEIFHVAKSKGEFKPFVGTYPASLIPWMERLGMDI